MKWGISSWLVGAESRYTNSVLAYLHDFVGYSLISMALNGHLTGFPSEALFVSKEKTSYHLRAMQKTHSLELPGGNKSWFSSLESRWISSSPDVSFDSYFIEVQNLSLSIFVSSHRTHSCHELAQGRNSSLSIIPSSTLRDQVLWRDFLVSS